MNKYIVQVNYNNNSISIITMKAKNDIDLERKIVKELVSIFDNLKDIHSIDYSKVRRYVFTNKPFWFIGNTSLYRGALEEILNKEMIK